MSWYDNITDKLESLNNTDYVIQIDDIDEKSIIFNVQDAEVTEEIIGVIEEVLDFINHKAPINLCGINYYPSENGNQESFNIYYKLDVGKDEKTEEELYQESQDDYLED